MNDNGLVFLGFCHVVPMQQMILADGSDWKLSHIVSNCKPQRVSFSSFIIKLEM